MPLLSVTVITKDKRHYHALNEAPLDLPVEVYPHVKRLLDTFNADFDGLSSYIPEVGANLQVRHCRTMDRLNAGLFLSTWRDEYLTARQASPADYSGDAEDVIARMSASTLRGTYNKDSESYKRTCKRLGIKHTYKAITAFLEGK